MKWKKDQVVHISTHVSLCQACDKVKKDRVLEVIRIANQSCIDKAMEEGICIPERKPTPPDTIFSKALGSWYDIVVEMYHILCRIAQKNNKTRMKKFRRTGT